MTKFVLPLLLAGAVVFAQGAELRDPTPAERQALDRIAGAIDKVFDEFNSPNWTLDEDRSHDELLVNGSDSGRPLDVNSDFHRSYSTAHGSPREQTLLMPLEKQVEAAQASGDTNTMLALGDKMENLGSVSLEAHINTTVLEAPADANPHAADVRGAALAYKLDEDACAWNDDSRGPCWVLAFGDWQHATRDGDMLNYHYQHKNLTPYVENVVIRMRGAEDRVEEMLQKADWPALVNGLTR
jgi:hypothetical protein